MSDGADWMLGKLEPKPQKKLQRAPTPVELDQVEKLLDEVAGDGKRLVAGMRAAVSALDALRTSGLTGEGFVTLVVGKCTRSKNGTRIGPETVQTVLEALFRLGEYVR